MDLLCFCSVLCLLCLCARLFICALWSPAGKGLTSWLSFVVSNCEFTTFPLISWVRCGTWLYRFLIFAPLLTLVVFGLENSSFSLNVFHIGSTWFIQFNDYHVYYRISGYILFTKSRGYSNIKNYKIYQTNVIILKQLVLISKVISQSIWIKFSRINLVTRFWDNHN